MEQEPKPGNKALRVFFIVMIILMLLSLPVLFVRNKIREAKKKNKFRLTGYTVSLGLFPSVDFSYEKTGE